MLPIPADSTKIHSSSNQLLFNRWRHSTPLNV